VKREYVESGVPFLLAQYIRPVLLEFDEPAQIAPSVAETIPQNMLSGGDVLVTRTGANYGDCAVYLGEPHPFYASAHCLVIRPRSVAGEYLAIYLNTSVGHALVKRGAYGSSQPELAPTYLRTIPVVRLGKIEDKVARLVREAHRQIRDAKTLYPKAERLLLERLGWDEVDTEHVLAYETRLSSARQAARLDAEHFQPKYHAVVARLKKKGSKLLGEFCPAPLRGVTPEYDPDGGIAIVNSKHMGPHGLDVSALETTTRGFYSLPENQRARLKRNDVLVYATGAYLGRTNTWTENRQAIAGIDVIILRPDRAVADPTYLALFLNSPPGLLQTEQRASGSAQRDIYPDDLVRVRVFLPRGKDGRPDLDWQHELGALVSQGYRARAAAQKKIEEAKRLVESAIREVTGLS
jgi:hypothetical protein